MKRILLIGAGRSASTLIQYLLDHAVQEDWHLTVADADPALAAQKVAGHARGTALGLDATDENARRAAMQEADLVLSLLPPQLHVLAARDALTLRKHLLTASYVSPEMAALDADARAAGLVFLNELGLDPGIDHMSAMELFEKVRAEGGEITAFRSYCGALLAPESRNLWGYKFTWAPRNVILAGQGTARFLENGKIKYRNYPRLFSETETIHVPGYGDFEAYANRDSLPYEHLYGLDGIPTLYRATLRNPGYCSAWNLFVQLGMTDDTYAMDAPDGLRYCDFLDRFVPELPGTHDLALRAAAFAGEGLEGPRMQRLAATGLLGTERIELKNPTPAQALQYVLERNWVFRPGDNDQVVMQHQVEYTRGSEQRILTSSMVVTGADPVHTAISRTVGLPAAIAAKYLLRGNITRPGVYIPIYPEVYAPILRELETLGIGFSEQDSLR